MFLIYTLPYLYGILLKLEDEIIYGYGGEFSCYLNFIKFFSIFVLTLLCITNPKFSFMGTVLCFVLFITDFFIEENKAFDNLYWYFIFFLCFSIFIFNFLFIFLKINVPTLFQIFIIFISISGVSFDMKYFKEEISIQKILLRGAYVFILTVLMFFSMFDFIKEIFIFAVGYFSAWFLMKLIYLFEKDLKTNNRREKSLSIKKKKNKKKKIKKLYKKNQDE